MRQTCIASGLLSLMLSALIVVSIGCARAPAPQSSNTQSSQPSNPPPSNPKTVTPATSEQPAPPPPPPPPKEGPALHHAHRTEAQNPASAAPSSNEYQLGDEVEAWKNNLKSGAIEYYVPPAMTAQQKWPVTVVVHGYQDTKTQTLPNPTGTGTLKVSSQMKVELLAPFNPGEFTIASQGNPAIQFIPNDGYATWMWNVIPADKAQNQQLQIRVSLIYPGKDGNIEQILEEKTYAVNVNVQKLTVTIEQSFWKDPLGWFKAILPGGAGWAAIAALVTSLGGLITWWRKRGKKEPAAAKEEEHR